MKTPTPDYTKDYVSEEDIKNWIKEGFDVNVQINVFTTNTTAYWDGSAVVVHDKEEVRAQ